MEKEDITRCGLDATGHRLTKKLRGHLRLFLAGRLRIFRLRRNSY